MHLVYRPEPADEELLSSYLTRCAGRHGMSVYRFRAFHFPAFRVWTRDIDRSAPRQLLRAIATDTGLTLARVTAMTLRGTERTVSVRRPRGTAAWVNALGVHHRVRRLHGLQYCPACLAEAPAYKKAWRLSFTVRCSRHRCPLSDACPYCDAPIMPHRQLAGAVRCHACHCSLVGALATHPPELSSAAAARQDACLRALDAGFAKVGKRRIPAQAYFRGLRILASVVAGGHDSREAIGTAYGRPIECMRAASRAEVLADLHAILSAWPGSFRALASARCWTRRTFHRMSVPAWLYDEVRRLPRGQVRRTTRGHSLRAKLVSLGKRRPHEWRTQRAALLVAAARERRR